MKMNEDFVLTQTKKVVMTRDKTTTTHTGKLELIDSFGRKTVVKEDIKESTVFHNEESRWCA